MLLLLEALVARVKSLEQASRLLSAILADGSKNKHKQRGSAGGSGGSGGGGNAGGAGVGFAAGA